MDIASKLSTVLVKPVSADCNLACQYCFYLSKSDLYPESSKHLMNADVLRELTEQFLLMSWNEAHFAWQGGEPTMAGLDFYREAVRLQSLYKMPSQQIYNSLQTNGVFIDESWAELFVSQKFLVGVSLDGPENLHDIYRMNIIGEGSHCLVMNGINALRAHDVDFNILALLNNENVKHPKQLYNYYVEKGLTYLQFIPCVEYDENTEKISDYSVSPEEYGRFLCEVFDEWFRDIPNVYVRDFEDILIGYYTGNSPNCTYSKECGRYIVVEYNGDVYPCDFFVESDWLLGNLLEQPLEEMLKCEKFHEFRRWKSRNMPMCAGCQWLHQCKGGCPKHWEIGDNALNYFCSSYKMLFEHANKRFLDLNQHVKKRNLDKFKK